MVKYYESYSKVPYPPVLAALIFSIDLSQQVDLFLRPVPAVAALTYSADLPNRLDLFLYTYPTTSRLDTLC